MATYDQHQRFHVNVAFGIELLAGALSKGSYIEALVLFQSIIDGLLRVLILIESSTRDGSISVPEGFVWQEDDKKKFTEKDIFEVAHEKKVISDNEFNELKDLYKERNKVIHRYMISNYKYSDIKTLCKRYTPYYEKLYQKLVYYEKPDESVISEQDIQRLRNMYRDKL